MARFVHDVHMRWMDMDAYRHVNNSSYLAYLEEARIAMFFGQYGSFASGTVIARHEIDYLLPVVYGREPLRLELWVEDVRAASFLVRYEVFDNGVLAARAQTKCVTYDFGAGRPRRLTPDDLQILAGYHDE